LENRLDEKPWLFDGHFRPQVDFIGPDTDVLRFEHDWPLELAKMFDLDPSLISHENPSPATEGELLEEERAFILRTYAVDYERFGYTPPQLSAV
ncbi:MAG: hypothetical protein AAFW69_09315, partial [Pseudomonadota bacterium]